MNIILIMESSCWSHAKTSRTLPPLTGSFEDENTCPLERPRHFKTDRPGPLRKCHTQLPTRNVLNKSRLALFLAAPANFDTTISHEFQNSALQATTLVTASHEKIAKSSIAKTSQIQQEKTAIGPFGIEEARTNVIIYVT